MKNSVRRVKLLDQQKKRKLEHNCHNLLISFHYTTLKWDGLHLLCSLIYPKRKIAHSILLASSSQAGTDNSVL